MGRVADWVDHLFGCDYETSTKAAAVNPADVEKRVYDIVCNIYDVRIPEISRETSFSNDLGSDSIDAVELVIELENEFGLSIPDEDANSLMTVGAAIDYIQGRVRQGQQT